MCVRACVCLELLLLLLLLLPLASISSRLWPNQQNSLSCPFGSPARVPIILWSNINVWYWACSLIQSQLILSVNYLQILRCGGRSPRTISARFRIRNWLPLSSPPPPPGLTSFFFLSPSCVFFLFFLFSSSPSFFVYVCLLKPKWLSFQLFRASGAGCCLGISIADISDIAGWGAVGGLRSGKALCLTLTHTVQSGNTVISFYHWCATTWHMFQIPAPSDSDC